MTSSRGQDLRVDVISPRRPSCTVVDILPDYNGFLCFTWRAGPVVPVDLLYLLPVLKAT